jgi:DNA-binding MarR family transcriptional regulator
MESGALNGLLGQLSRLHYRRSNAEFSKLGITRGQPRILRYLKTHEGCIQRELSESCHLEPASITHILEKMVQRGLVDKRFEPGSHRNIQVFLTEQGRQALTIVETVYRRLEEEFFTGFSAEERGLAASLLGRMTENMLAADNEKNMRWASKGRQTL